MPETPSVFVRGTCLYTVHLHKEEHRIASARKRCVMCSTSCSYVRRRAVAGRSVVVSLARVVGSSHREHSLHGRHGGQRFSEGRKDPCPPPALPLRLQD